MPLPSYIGELQRHCRHHGWFKVCSGCALGGMVRKVFGYADSLLAAGDIEGSLAAYARLAGGTSKWTAAVAWRVGLVHYLLRGSPRDALEHLNRGVLEGEDTADEALLLSWLASVHWALGDLKACAEYADRAAQAAEAAGDDRAKAGAHVALALRAMLEGDRIGNSTHYAHALRFASAAGDSIQIIRVKTNLSSHFMDEGNYARALEHSRDAVRLAEKTGNAVLLAVALTNEGDALSAMGRLTEAVDRFSRAIQLCQQVGSSKVCFGLVGLGDVQRRRGHPSLARSAYEEVIPLAEEHGHVQVLVSALAGLAEVLCESDCAAAATLAKRALELAVGPFTTIALLATARVTLASGDREMAARLAEDAQCSARSHRDRPGVAHALELQAKTCEDRERACRYLVEARGIWSELGSTFDADRVTVVLGQLAVSNPDSIADQELAAGRLAAVTSAYQAQSAPGVAIRTLGRFEVLVGGEPLSPSAWQSRKARDLLRLLIARRGRPVTREELVDLLWGNEPGVTAERKGHRLAVALSIVRGVVDGTRQVVMADGSSIALEVSRMTIDLETFMRQAEYGLRLHRAGRGEDGHAALVAAEARYTGDFLEDEPYEDWAMVPREEARATYLRVGRVLADDALRRGDTDEAIHYLLRILAVDAYDEQGHLDLIEAYALAGRHGEVRRARGRYAGAMREIGVQARA